MLVEPRDEKPPSAVWAEKSPPPPAERKAAAMEMGKRAAVAATAAPSKGSGLGLSGVSMGGGGLTTGIASNIARGRLSASQASPGFAAVPSTRDAQMNTENYAHITDNAFLAVADQPLSTFSIDVDTASYSNARRFLNDGTLPPKDAIRVEEWLNYFSYSYPEPVAKEPFSVTSEVSVCPGIRRIVWCALA